MMNETLDDSFPSLTKARERFLRRQPSPNKVMKIIYKSNRLFKKTIL